MLLKQILKTSGTHRECDRLCRVAGKVSRQTIVFEIIRDQHRLTCCRQKVRSCQEVAEIDLSGSEKIPHSDLHQLEDLAGFNFRFRGKALMSTADHIDIYFRDRAETSPLDQNRPLPQYFRRLQYLTGCSEHRGPAKAKLDEPKAHDAVVDMAELDTGKLDHIDFDAFCTE